jgi:hypothetical protein
MAQLTNADYTEIKEIIHGNPAAWVILKAWGLDKQTWKGLFQAAENWFVTGFNAVPTTSFKAALEAVAGPMTGSQAQIVGKAWFVWRIGQEW